jgi:capsular polysaccharide biosynthesis protein
MADIIYALRRRRGFLLTMGLFPPLVALVISLVIPKEYLSHTSILPANSRLSDRARFTADQINELYSAFGSGDDLDRIFATARSQPVMMKIVDSFKLVGHYRLTGKGVKAREAALKEFRSRSSIVKTEYGEMHINVWDKDPDLAAGLANAMVAQTEKVHQDLYRSYYTSSLERLRHAFEQLRKDGLDEMPEDTSNMRRQQTGSEMEFYRRSITDYRMALLNPPPVLMVLEKAIPAVKPDRPKILVNVLATFLVSLFTGVAAVLLMSGQKKGSL